MTLTVPIGCPRCGETVQASINRVRIDVDCLDVSSADGKAEVVSALHGAVEFHAQHGCR